MTDTTPQPGTYVKGDDVKVASTAAKAVALAFEGYKLQSDEVPESANAGTATGPSSTSPTPDVPSGTPAATPVPRAPRGSTTSTTTS